MEKFKWENDIVRFTLERLLSYRLRQHSTAGEWPGGSGCQQNTAQFRLQVTKPSGPGRQKGVLLIEQAELRKRLG